MFGDRSTQLLEVQQIVILISKDLNSVLYVLDCKEHFSVKFCRPCCTSHATCSSNLRKQIPIQTVPSLTVKCHKPNKHKLLGMAEELSAAKAVLQAKDKPVPGVVEKVLVYILCWK